MSCSWPAWQLELERRVRAHDWYCLSKGHLARWLEIHDYPMPFALQCDSVTKEQMTKIVLMRLKAEKRAGKLVQISDDALGRTSARGVVETPVKAIDTGVVETPEKTGQLKRLRAEASPQASLIQLQDKKPRLSASIAHQTKDWFHSQWRFTHLLGTGSCSRVRQGVHRPTNKEFAVKIIDMKKLELRRARTNSSNEILTEVEIAKMLYHPGIVRCHDCFQIQDHLYIVMDFMPGGNLLEHIEKYGHFVEVQARALFQELCDAIRYLHDKLIVHRDIKGENILLTSTDRRDLHPKLSDFGISSRCLGTHDRQTIRGTLLYMAPEIWGLHNKSCPSQGYGRRVDMWSLGVVLYIILCARPPFDDFDFDGELHFAEPEWTLVSAAAKDLVCQLIVPDPEERLSSQKVLDHDWFPSRQAEKDVATADAC
eukprot:TRINITY_DN21646_c0_g1_i2.p1 TRINITY_DN21646_c0_g1~~TRINITY_DN21646_c0_g1_i2.p1  ORF type:complete len:426 (-),score=50.03 TRINITY_DN21646_c0_g1_i2:228-1505(-)